jgi:hypothetical protein
MDRRLAWAAIAAALLGALVVGVASFNAGVSHGLAISPALANAQPGVVVPYGWYRPWGFGFGVGPLFLVLFSFLALRMVLHGGPHRRRWHAGDERDAPPFFEDWHRRAHERMNRGPAAPQS